MLGIKLTYFTSQKRSQFTLQNKVVGVQFVPSLKLTKRKGTGVFWPGLRWKRQGNVNATNQVRKPLKIRNVQITSRHDVTKHHHHYDTNMILTDEHLMFYYHLWQVVSVSQTVWCLSNPLFSSMMHSTIWDSHPHATELPNSPVPKLLVLAFR